MEPAEFKTYVSISHNNHNVKPHQRISYYIHQGRTIIYYPSLFIFLILLHAISSIPPQCNQLPPTTDCSGPYNVGYYYNGTNSGRCLSWPDWGCLGSILFPTEQECLDTCHSDVPSSSSDLPSPSPSPSQLATPPPTRDEVCNLQVKNIFCPQAIVTTLWVYNPTMEHCHILRFFSNCLPRQLNMFDTEEECNIMCVYNPLPSTSSSPRLMPPSQLQPLIIVTSTSILHTNQPKSSAISSAIESSHHTLISTTAVNNIPTPVLQSPTTEITMTTTTDMKPEVTDDDENLLLTEFDMASIGVGVLVILLILVMVILIILFIRRRRKIMKCQPTTAVRTVSDPISAQQPNHNGNCDIHFVNQLVKSYPPTTSCYV